MDPFYSSVPSLLGNPREDGLVFLSLLPPVNLLSPAVWMWFPSFMAVVLRLPANVICLQAGDVRHLPKRTLQSPGITAGADGRQVYSAWVPAEEPDFSSWIPSWRLTSASTSWDRLGLLLTASAWCTQTQESKLGWRPSRTQHSQTFSLSRFFPVAFWGIFFFFLISREY